MTAIKVADCRTQFPYSESVFDQGLKQSVVDVVGQEYAHIPLDSVK